MIRSYHDSLYPLHYLHYHVKGAFCIGLIFGTFFEWLSANRWPHALAEDPVTEPGDIANDNFTWQTTLLLFDMLFLYVLTLNGLARSLSDLSKLTLPNGSIPRGRWLFIVCGFTTMISGAMSGPPILISPESAAGIKAGAKTGLSSLICGILFGISCFFSPFFAAIPSAGTAPLLIMVGVLLFQNSKRIDWYQPKYSVPAYCCLFFIPFTYSILRGVAFGYVTYVVIGMFTGDFWVDSFQFLHSYLVPQPKPVVVEEEKAAPSQPINLMDMITDPSKFAKSVAESKMFDMTHDTGDIKAMMDMGSKKIDEQEDIHDPDEDSAVSAARAKEEMRKKMELASSLFSNLKSNMDPLTVVGGTIQSLNPLASPSTKSPLHTHSSKGQKVSSDEDFSEEIDGNNEL